MDFYLIEENTSIEEIKDVLLDWKKNNNDVFVLCAYLDNTRFYYCSKIKEVKTILYNLKKEERTLSKELTTDVKIWSATFINKYAFELFNLKEANKDLKLELRTIKALLDEGLYFKQPEKKYAGYGYHGGGRPKKASKAISFSISGNNEEIEALKKNADSEGLTVSKYIFNSLKENEIIKEQLAQITDENTKLKEEIKAIKETTEPPEEPEEPIYNTKELLKELDEKNKIISRLQKFIKNLK